MPLAVKDNMCTADLPTTCASKILEGFVPPYDATVIAKARAAGLVTIGKTNLDEFAMGTSTENSAYFPTRNPWDPDLSPGGSSGGSAVAVSAEMAPLSSFPSLEAWEVLHAHRARYIVLHWNRFTPEEHERVTTAMPRLRRLMRAIVEQPDASLFEVVRWPRRATLPDGGDPFEPLFGG